MFDFTGTAPNRPIRNYGYYGDDKDPGTSGQISIRQEGGILTKRIIRIYRTDGVEHIFTVRWLTKTSNNILRSWWWISICNRWNIRNQDICDIYTEPPYSTERQMLHTLVRLQKIQQHLHYLENICQRYESSMDLELLHSATISSCCYWF